MRMNQNTTKPEFIGESFRRISDELSKVIVGHQTLIQDIFICLVCGGHALIEGVPGLGKTLIVKSISQVLDLKYSRIQFTPDLMPADILGTNILMQDENGNRYFEFQKGPIFSQVILADEINRATPKTQSALLEAMQESKVTVFGTEHLLDPPFIVLATQNPLEMEGTYPLPEAQLDRFFFKLKVEFPNPAQLNEIIDKTTEEDQPELHKLIDGRSILEIRRLVKQVPTASHVKDYAIRLVLSTHPHERFSTAMTKKYVRIGSSPRGVQSLVLASKVRALLQGRFNTAFEDIKEVAKPSLRHRIIVNFRAEAEGVEAEDIIDDVLGKTPPRGVC